MCVKEFMFNLLKIVEKIMLEMILERGIQKANVEKIFQNKKPEFSGFLKSLIGKLFFLVQFLVLFGGYTHIFLECFCKVASVFKPQGICYTIYGTIRFL